MYLINLIYVNHLDAPAWFVCLLAVAVSTTLAILGLLLFRKIFPNALNKANNDCISLSLSTVGLFSSVLISLIVVSTWNFYTSVDQGVNQEAHAVEDFYKAAQGISEPTRSLLMKDVREYVNVVIKEEWPAMNANQAVSDKGRLILMHSNDALLQFKTNDLIMANTQSKALDRLSELFDARRDRIISTKTHVPMVIWMVMFLSAFLTVAVSYLYTAESVVMHVIATGFIAASLAATLFLIVIFGHPFQGSMRINPDTFISFQQQNLK